MHDSIKKTHLQNSGHSFRHRLAALQNHILYIIFETHSYSVKLNAS